MATVASSCLSMATALFIAVIASVVSSLLTELMTSMNCSPPSAASLFLSMTKDTFWKPKTPLGSFSTVYLPLASCASVVNMFAASTLPVSSAWYWTPRASWRNLALSMP